MAMKGEPRVGDIPNNLIIPKELLLSWAAGLVRAVCGVDDDIAEPVRRTALQMTTLMERARPRVCGCTGWDHVPAYPSGICPDCGHWYPGKRRGDERYDQPVSVEPSKS